MTIKILPEVGSSKNIKLGRETISTAIDKRFNLMNK